MLHTLIISTYFFSFTEFMHAILPVKLLECSVNVLRRVAFQVSQDKSN